MCGCNHPQQNQEKNIDHMNVQKSIKQNINATKILNQVLYPIANGFNSAGQKGKVANKSQ
jgi:hypothetical protein